MNELDAFWQPFTATRDFAAAPRLLARAEGMYYYTPAGRPILDGFAGLWCVNAGHARQPIIEAVTRQASLLDYAPSFELGHPLAFEAAHRICALTDEFQHAFFTSSGSEGVETALKMALAYHAARGEPQRTLLVGRERGYHGSTFMGVAIGGHAAHRALFRSGLPGNIEHLPATHLPGLFARGQPEAGAQAADELERRLVALHDPTRVAAVIVEPVAGSTGVLVPPTGYLERLRAICDKYGILLIFDEVMTGFGRMGKAFAYQRFNVVPDLLVFAKAVTNALIPMGGVLVPGRIRAAIQASAAQGAIEFMHGFTYSGHPVAAAAAIATLDLYARENLFEAAANLAPVLEDHLHGLADLPHVRDIRNIGLVGAVELHPRPGKPRQRGREVQQRAFDAGVLVRFVGDTIVLAPPLIISAEQIGQIVTTLREIISAVE